MAQLISRQAETNIDADDTSSAGELHRVDVDSLQLVRPRTVGVEHVALWAMQQVGLPALLAQLGLNSRQQAAAGGIDHWPSGGAGFRTCDTPLAARNQCAGRLAGGRLRELQPKACDSLRSLVDAAIPGLRCTDGASGGD